MLAVRRSGRRCSCRLDLPWLLLSSEVAVWLVESLLGGGGGVDDGVDEGGRDLSGLGKRQAAPAFVVSAQSTTPPLPNPACVPHSMRCPPLVVLGARPCSS